MAREWRAWCRWRLRRVREWRNDRSQLADTDRTGCAPLCFDYRGIVPTPVLCSWRWCTGKWGRWNGRPTEDRRLDEGLSRCIWVMWSNPGVVGLRGLVYWWSRCICGLSRSVQSTLHRNHRGRHAGRLVTDVGRL
jgi:hypothetical protein